MLQIFSFMIEVSTPKGSLLILPLKATKDSKFFDSDFMVCSLTSQCDAHCWAWLFSMMNTVELDSAVWCTPQSFLRNLGHLPLRRNAHCRAWHCGMMYTTESESAVCITPRSQTSSKMSVFVFLNLFRLSTKFNWKTSKVKMIPKTICDVRYIFIVILWGIAEK